MNSVWLKRRGDGLFPYDSTGELVLEQYPQGKPLKAKIWMPRNADTNRLYHAILTHVAHAMGENIDRLDKDIRVRAGFYDQHHTEKCGIVKIARSTSFTACEDEIEFLQFFDQALAVIHGELGIPPAALADLMKGRDK